MRDVFPTRKETIVRLRGERLWESGYKMKARKNKPEGVVRRFFHGRNTCYISGQDERLVVGCDMALGAGFGNRYKN